MSSRSLRPQAGVRSQDSSHSLKVHYSPHDPLDDFPIQPGCRPYRPRHQDSPRPLPGGREVGRTARRGLTAAPEERPRMVIPLGISELRSHETKKEAGLLQPKPRLQSLRPPECFLQGLVPLVLFLAVVVIYLPSIGNDFLYDDYEVILSNDPVESVGDLAQIFSERVTFPACPTIAQWFARRSCCRERYTVTGQDPFICSTCS